MELEAFPDEASLLLHIRENIALRQSLTNPYNICIFKNIHNSGKSTGKAIKA